jgi:hypothetical protein
MRRTSIAAIAIAAVAALSVAMGWRERNARAELEAGSSLTAAILDDSLPAVVVMARRPTLSEIVALVLHERPTAAELARDARAANEFRSGEFPKGEFPKGEFPKGEFPKGSDEAYVAGILARRTSDRSMVHRVAAAIVKEGRRRNIGTPLLVGVLLTENPMLDPRATSSVGARGLMQVMPFHAGKWGCGSQDLFDVESNICHGVAVLADNLRHARNLPQALLGYNGCVRGTNTPDCWRYPHTVYRKADFKSGAP